jgi:hypothetical protein
VRILNALAFLALFVTLFPTGGKLPEKPAGYRTALELLDKRGQSPLRTMCAQCQTLPV